MIYIDTDGTRYFVSQGISRDEHTWMTVSQKPGRGTHRVKSKSLPIVETKEAAQKLLDDYAADKNWRPLKAC